MRPTKILRKLLGLTQLLFSAAEMAARGLVIDARPSWTKPRCGLCHRRCSIYDTADEPRYWRHLTLGRVPIWIRHTMRRANCPVHGATAEWVPWAAHQSFFTLELEELVAYLAQRMDKTAVTHLVGINWRTVGTIVARVVKERLDSRRFDNLYIIGIDEISYRRQHEYVTVIVDHAKHRVVWTGKGKGADTLKQFFAEIGPERTAQIQAATLDMSAAFISALDEVAPHVTKIFDRFHVQALASDAVDEVRRAEVRRLAGTDEAQCIKKTRFALLKNPWNLTRREGQRLRDLQANNRTIYRAYLLKESLAKAYDYLQPARAEKAFVEWISWAKHSRLEPFVKLARTVERHIQGILAYTKSRLANGLTEGLNNKTRLITRRAFGFHGDSALCSMIHLVCGGIPLNPPIPAIH